MKEEKKEPWVIPYSEVLKRQYPSDSAHAGSASGEKATVPEGSPLGVNYWYVLLAILAFIGNVIFFLPLCILGLFGLSKHPFLGYFMFRDIFRKS